jgi:hypothetical protein
MRSIALPLLGQQMPQLQSLSLEHVFISDDLSAFIVAHSDTLESIRLDHCYSGWKRESATCWGDFFSSIASKNMKSLRTFNIAASDLEQMQHKDSDDHDYYCFPSQLYSVSRRRAKTYNLT